MLLTGLGLGTLEALLLPADLGWGAILLARLLPDLVRDLAPADDGGGGGGCDQASSCTMGLLVACGANKFLLAVSCKDGEVVLTSEGNTIRFPDVTLEGLLKSNLKY